MPKSFATIVLKLDKQHDAIWDGFVRTFSDAELHELPGTLIVSVQVTNYSLTDHQFAEIKLRLKIKNESKEASMLVPRHLIETIIETKNRLDVKGFKFPAG